MKFTPKNESSATCCAMSPYTYFDISEFEMTRILVVDDSYVNREVIRCTLEPLGYQIILAHNVEEGLVLARQVSPDLILSDVHMPNQDGFTFITSLKSDPKLSQIPFVFLSASIWGEKDQRKGLSLGAVRFILRPIEPQQLLREVEECLNGR